MKMIKKISLVALAVTLLVLNGCGGSGSGKLVVWSFTDELKDMITKFDAEKALDVKIDYSLTPTDQFPNRLDPVLSAGSGAPDVFALESAFVRKYVEAGPDLLLDLTDIANEVRANVLSYPIDVATYEGKVYAMAWQATPGALFYKRSLAKQYLGTDDPDQVQAYFNNWDNYLATARQMNQQSGGKAVVLGAVDELLMPFKASRTAPWVVDGQLNIDPAMLRYMEMAKTLRDGGLDGRTVTWSESWFAGMRGELVNEMGTQLDVFSVLLPTWGLHYVLKTNAPDTAGDWAMIPGPTNWFWGGTWIAAYAGTKQPEMAKNFIRLLTTNETNLESWALDTGDFLNNMNIVNRIKDNFTEPFLGGQNHYAAFAQMAPGIDGSMIQGTDQAIEALFMETLTQYINNEATLDGALATLRTQVQAQLGLSARN